MVDAGIPHKDYEVAKDGKTIGVVMTGMFGPTLKKNLGLGFVLPEFARLGTELDVVVPGKPLNAGVIKMPSYANLARRK